MAATPLTMSPAYLAMVRGTRELHRLLAEGKDDSPDADAVRDATDGPWHALSEVERERVRKLSEDLYSLTKPPASSQPMNPQAQKKLTEAYEAKQRGEWDRALDLLRRWGTHIDPTLLSYLRGSIWLEAGDPETAAQFFAHAHELEPFNGNYQALALYALNKADPAKASKQAQDILDRHRDCAPAVVARAADIVFMTTRTRSDAEARHLAEVLEPILTATLDRIRSSVSGDIDHPTYVTLLSLLGFCYEFQGRVQEAEKCYSQGLQVDPNNDGLLVSRGMLLYGTSPRAILDLERAIQCRTPLVWPSIMLAHHNLITGRPDECRKLCERALGMGGSPAVMSEVAEWLAIAQAQLGFPVEMVRGTFDSAIRLDPSNERARKNLAAFENAVKPITTTAAIWETRSAGAVRSTGLTERHYPMVLAA